MKLYLANVNFIAISLLILAIDQFSKAWAIGHLIMGEPLTVLPIFNLTLAYNRGMAFSLLHDVYGWENIIFTVIASGVSIFLSIYLLQMPRSQFWLKTAFALILGGALGNLYDRITQGYVTDFLDFHLGTWHFATFNLADSAVCLGAMMLALKWILQKP